MLLGTIANLYAIDNQKQTVIDNQNQILIEPVPIDTVLKPPSSTDQAVVDKANDDPFPKPNDSPFPSDRRSSRRKPPKPLHIKATNTLENENVVNKEDPIKPPLPEPQSDNLKSKQSRNQPDVSIVKDANDESPVIVEQVKQDEIAVEHVPSDQKLVDSAIDKDAIAKEEAIVKEEFGAKQPENENKEKVAPDLKEMVDHVAKEIKETQIKLSQEMNAIKQQMEVLDSQKRLSEPANAQSVNNQKDADVESLNAQNRNVDHSNIHKPSDLDSNAQDLNIPQANEHMQNMNGSTMDKSNVVVDGEKNGKVPVLSIPIPLMVSGSNSEMKKKSNSDTVQSVADDGSVKVVAEQSEHKAPSVNDNINSIGGRDLLSEKADSSIKTQNL